MSRRRGCLALTALVLACSSALPDTSIAGGGVKTLRVGATPSGAQTEGKVQKGIASIYRDTRTASGERYCPKSYCAAHPTLPMGTKVKVTHAKSGRSVVVRINDRGPFQKGRIIDLTPAAAASIGLQRSQGITKVELSVVEG